MSLKDLLLEKTELKHNVNQRLGLIFEPFSWMSIPDAVYDDFFTLFGEECSSFAAEGKRLCLELDRKWYNNNDSLEKQVESYFTSANQFRMKAIPLIEKTIALYEKIGDYSNLFNVNNPIGFRALQSIETAKRTAPSLIQDLNTMGTRISEENGKLDRVNLLTVLERVFDQILKADVRYLDVLPFSLLEVKIDESLFVNSVLNNIKENIINHAFSTGKTKGNFVFENQVKVSFEDRKNSIVVSISNNGAPFKGDCSRLFTPEYYHGQKGHSGYGLHSARKAMRSMGGDLSITTGKGESVFTYIITLKKNI